MALPRNAQALRSAHGGGTITDNHSRAVNYLRLAITDRCNLRCRYCMPAHGVDTVPHHDVLSFEEMERLVRILSVAGISKVRITGGEPFARLGCLQFMQRVAAMDSVTSLHLTTNGVATHRHLDGLRDLGLSSINLSLDTLDRQRFVRITRRDHLHQVLATLEGALARDILVKINSVVLDDTDDSEIVALANLARHQPVSVRFIEKMPFSGGTCSASSATGTLRQRLHDLFPNLAPILAQGPTTARLFALPGFAGTLGVIEGNSRKFCGSCNKIRVTPSGMLKTCLYDNGVLDIRRMLRNGSENGQIAAAVISCLGARQANGHEAEAIAMRDGEPSMASIGG